MARTRKAMTSELLNEMIEKAQAKVERTKKSYENAKTELSDLTKRRDDLRKETLWETVLNSEKSYDDILAFAEKKETAEETTEY